MKKILYILLFIPFLLNGQGMNVMHTSGRSTYGAAPTAPTNILTNGTFDDATNWSFGTSWAYDGVGQEADYDGLADGFITQFAVDMQGSIDPLTNYTLSFDVSGTTGANIEFTDAANRKLLTAAIYTNDSYSIDVTAPADFDGNLRVQASSAGDAFTIDNISIVVR